MNILFVTSTRIGDAVLSTGLLGHLVATLPDARVTVACGALPAPLFHAAPGVVRVIPLTKRPLAGHWLALWARVMGTVWDCVVDLRGSGLAWVVPARRRYVLHRADDDLHRLQSLAKLFDLPEAPLPRLWLTEADKAAARRLLPGNAPVLGLGPTANWPAKIWPADRFVSLAERLTAGDGILPGVPVAVFGGPGEHAIAAPVLEALAADRRIDLVGSLDLPAVAACLARCALFVGNDSGLMHMAAAAGTPTVGLFGPSRTEHYGPQGRHCAVATTDIPYEDLVGRPDFDHRATESLMTTLSVEAVEQEVRALWRRLAGQAA